MIKLDELNRLYWERYMEPEDKQNWDDAIEEAWPEISRFLELSFKLSKVLNEQEP